MSMILLIINKHSFSYPPLVSPQWRIPAPDWVAYIVKQSNKVALGGHCIWGFMAISLTEFEGLMTFVNYSSAAKINS